MIKLINEDFKDFPLEEFPYDHDHSALGEYHYYMPKGYTGNFYDPISLHQWRSMGGSWIVTESFGKYYMEQNRGDNTKGHFSDVSAILVHKMPLYASYTLSINITLLETKNPVGIAFNYIHNRKYDSIVLDGKSIIMSHRNQKIVDIYAKKDFEMKALKPFNLKLVMANEAYVYIDDNLIFSYPLSVKHGTKLALIAKSACRYTDFCVQMDDYDYQNHLALAKEHENKIMQKRANYSQLECIHKIDLKNFGSARQLRVAYDENHKPIFILAQHQKRMYRDSFARLSSFTVFDYEGNILWQFGKPNNSVENTLISCDLPIQISDIDNDGRQEVIFACDFYVYIADLMTGKIKKMMKTPLVKGDPLVPDYPYDHLNPDGLRVADFEGKGYQGDFILKDRYHNVWAYSAESLTNLWRYNHKNTGHFPYIWDFNKDGKDEMLVGYDMVDSKGNIVWSLPYNSDHTDEIILANTKNGEERLYLASGNEGFNIVNLDGTIYRSNQVGHAQRISIAHYDSNREGFQVAVTSFWGADHIIYLFDEDGNLLNEKEVLCNGNLVTPVAYDGKNELILLNASIDGGLLDGNLDCVVQFPQDGHPTMCSEVLDIDGDGVDEIICWDLQSMWIYKAQSFTTGQQYDKYPDNSMSNYRGEYLIRKRK